MSFFADDDHGADFLKSSCTKGQGPTHDINKPMDKKRKGVMGGMLGKSAAAEDEVDDGFFQEFNVCDLDEPMFTSAAQKKAKPSNSNTGSFSGMTGLLEATSQLPIDAHHGSIPRPVEGDEHLSVDGAHAEDSAEGRNLPACNDWTVLQESGKKQASQQDHEQQIDARHAMMADGIHHSNTDSIEGKQSLTPASTHANSNRKGVNYDNFDAEDASTEQCGGALRGDKCFEVDHDNTAAEQEAVAKYTTGTGAHHSKGVAVFKSDVLTSSGTGQQATAVEEAALQEEPASLAQTPTDTASLADQPTTAPGAEAIQAAEHTYEQQDQETCLPNGSLHLPVVHTCLANAGKVTSQAANAVPQTVTIVGAGVAEPVAQLRTTACDLSSPDASAAGGPGVAKAESPHMLLHCSNPTVHISARPLYEPTQSSHIAASFVAETMVAGSEAAAATAFVAADVPAANRVQSGSSSGKAAADQPRAAFDASVGLLQHPQQDKEVSPPPLFGSDVPPAQGHSRAAQTGESHSMATASNMMFKALPAGCNVGPADELATPAAAAGQSLTARQAQKTNPKLQHSLPKVAGSLFQSLALHRPRMLPSQIQLSIEAEAAAAGAASAGGRLSGATSSAGEAMLSSRSSKPLKCISAPDLPKSLIANAAPVGKVEAATMVRPLMPKVPALYQPFSSHQSSKTVLFKNVSASGSADRAGSGTGVCAAASASPFVTTGKHLHAKQAKHASQADTSSAASVSHQPPAANPEQKLAKPTAEAAAAGAVAVGPTAADTHLISSGLSSTPKFHVAAHTGQPEVAADAAAAAAAAEGGGQPAATAQAVASNTEDGTSVDDQLLEMSRVPGNPQPTIARLPAVADATVTRLGGPVTMPRGTRTADKDDGIPPPAAHTLQDPLRKLEQLRLASESLEDQLSDLRVRLAVAANRMTRISNPLLEARIRQLRLTVVQQGSSDQTSA